MTKEAAIFPYSLSKADKDTTLTGSLVALSQYHKENCAAYARILSSMGIDLDNISDYRSLPFLPVGIFKRMALTSSRTTDVDGGYKLLTSSGTTGQSVSQIFLDGETRSAQQKALAEIGVNFLGEKRLPMLVIDCPGTVKDRTRFSARTAGILGFSLFGVHRTFALTDDMELDKEAIDEFLSKYGGEPFLIFGFTFMIWKYLYLIYADNPQMAPDLSNAVLIHGGGWKKLSDQAVSKEEYKSALRDVFKINRVHDYYGMAEQAGSIFMECECGHLHCSDYSDVLIRRHTDFSLCEQGERGLIQVISTIPKSYPGHSILTEDEGAILGTDDCPCGRKGSYFEVYGRIAKAQLRGCSDVYDN